MATSWERACLWLEEYLGTHRSNIERGVIESLEIELDAVRADERARCMEEYGAKALRAVEAARDDERRVQHWLSRNPRESKD